MFDTEKLAMKDKSKTLLGGLEKITTLKVGNEEMSMTNYQNW